MSDDELKAQGLKLMRLYHKHRSNPEAIAQEAAAMLEEFHPLVVAAVVSEAMEQAGRTYGMVIWLQSLHRTEL